MRVVEIPRVGCITASPARPGVMAMVKALVAPAVMAMSAVARRAHRRGDVGGQGLAQRGFASIGP